MAEYDTAELVSDIQQRGSLPANDLRFTDTLLLAAATREVREGVAPMLVASRAEHMVYTYTATVTSGTAQYRMPPRAVGGALRDVNFTPSGSGSTPIRLRELSSDEVEIIGNTNNQGTPNAYYVRNYFVVLVPQPNLSGTLTMPFYARPNRLVLQGTAAVSGARAIAIANVGGDTTFITLFTNPPAALIAATTVDIVRGTPGFETLVSGASVLVENLGGTIYRFSVSGLASGVGLSISVGDYLCLPGEAPVPQVPVELHGLLAARTARRVVGSTGDDKWQSLDADVAELEQKAKDWLAPRVASHTQQSGGSIGYSGLAPVSGWGWGLGP